MKDIAWSSILSVGVAEIDDDHRLLIALFNELNRAAAAGESAAYLAATLEELINCTVWHFSHEERLMLKHGFPGIEPHKAAHRELIDAALEWQAAPPAAARAKIVRATRVPLAWCSPQLELQAQGG